MTVPGNLSSPLLATAADSAADFQISRSLRFSSGDSAYLNRTPSSAGTRTKWSWSGWVKRGKLGAWYIIFSATGTGNDYIGFEPSNRLVVDLNNSTDGRKLTTRVFRDCSAFYHIVVAADYTSATANDRIKIYINGVLEETFDTNTAPTQNYTGNFNNNVLHNISGLNATPQDFFDGYLAGSIFVDGSAIAASDVGEYDSNNVWQPKQYSGTYGTNGFRLTFADNSSNSALGNDSSGNDNDWTVYNLRAESDTRTLPGVAFDGSGDNLSLADSDDWNFGSGDFTVETWVNQREITNTSAMLINQWGATGLSGTWYLNFTSLTSIVAVFRDDSNLNNTGNSVNLTGTVSANKWHHIAVTRSSNTWRLFVDGQLQQSATSSITIPDAPEPLRIGMQGYTPYRNGEPFDGYVSNVRIVKGTAVYTSNFTPSTSLTNVTNTKLLCCQSSSSATAATVGGTITANGDAYAGSFSDSTPENDSLIDTPTNYTAASGNAGGNYATLNPLDSSSNYTLSNGNLNYTHSTSGHQMTSSTIAVNSGKWYVEVTPTALGGTYMQIGISPANTSNTTYTGNNGYGYIHSGSKQGLAASSASYGNSYAANDVIGIAFDADGGNLYFYKNGVAQNSGTAAFTSIDTSKHWRFSVSHFNSGTGFVNFGQRPFSQTVPTGYSSLVTTNLSDPTIADGSTAFDTKLWTGTGVARSITGYSFSPDLVWGKARSATNTHWLMDTVRGAGNRLVSADTRAEDTPSGVLTSFNSDGFSIGTNTESNNSNGTTYVGWAWDAGANSSKTFTVKVVSDSGNKYRFDDFGTSAVTLDLEEGSTYVFDQSDSSNSGHPLRFSTTSDGTHGSGSEYTTGVTATGTPGSAGAKTTIVVAASAPTLYYYCSAHSGMGGQANTNSTAGASNFDGNIQTTIRANQSAGFSIVTWTGSGTSGDTVGHGLNAQPFLILSKRRNAADYWPVYHKNITAGNALKLNDTDAEFGGAQLYTSTAPTSSVFSVGDNNNINGNGDTYVAYCFAPVEGYSAFGSYEGTGSASTAAFVYTGMRPRWILVKNADDGTSASDWFIYDTARSTFNAADDQLYPNRNNAEAVTSTHAFDILSNGFKVKSTSTSALSNKSGNTYIYAAFAEHPLRHARAR